jgi:hypothetical protein
MPLQRAGGLRLVTAAVTIACASCRDRHPSGPAGGAPASSPAAAPSPAPLTGADLAAYARGREREVALLRGALDRLRRANADSAARREAVLGATLRSVEREGAAAAGLPLERYRALGARMDTVLRSRGQEGASVEGVAGAPAAGDSGSRETWRRLDSLRVELAVLRSWFAAAAEGNVAP